MNLLRMMRCPEVHEPPSGFRSLTLLPLLAGMLIWLLAASAQADAWPALEAELNQRPAELLIRIKELQQHTSHSPAQRAELHLLAGEAELLLTRGREAMQQADAGLALLPADAETKNQQAWFSLSVRLQLLRANAHDLLGQPTLAMPAVNALLQRLNQTTPQLLAEALATRGNLLLSQNDASGALADLQQAYQLAAETDPRVARGDIASSIGNVYARQRDQTNASRYFQEAVDYFQRIKSDIKLSIAVYGLGTVYRDAVNWPEARRHFGWSLELSRARADWQGVAYAQQQLAHIAIETGNYQDAQHLLDAAQPLFEHAEDHAMVVNTLISRADLSGAKKQHDAALVWLDKAEAMAQQHALDWLQPQIRLRRAELLAEQGKYEPAYQAFRSFHLLNEAVFRKESDRRLQELQVQFESERQAQQNTVLRQQNALQEASLQQQRSRLWLYVAVALLSLLSTFFLLYVIYKDRRVRQQLDALAHTDELTGLSNRRHLMQEAQLEIERARRYDLPLCLAVLDLDHFKQINDRFGHGIGDEVLRRFARVCRSSLRQTDVIGRIGGEEFVLLLPHTQLPIAEQIVERVRNEFKNADWHSLRPGLMTSVSIGLTALQPRDGNLAELMRRADEGLYQAKQQGRDRVVVIEVAAPIQTRISDELATYEKY